MVYDIGSTIKIIAKGSCKVFKIKENKIKF